MCSNRCAERKRIKDSHVRVSVPILDNGINTMGMAAVYIFLESVSRKLPFDLFMFCDSWTYLEIFGNGDDLLAFSAINNLIRVISVANLER